MITKWSKTNQMSTINNSYNYGISLSRTDFYT